MSDSAPDQPSIGTFGNEERLPRVPLPTLEASCARFVEWCAPLLTAEELAATEAAVAELLRGDGPARRLQAALREYDRRPDTHSWLDEFWRVRYLGRRDRIALNANYFFLFQPTGEDQVTRAAGLVAGALAYHRKISEERVPPAVHRGRPLSMVQHRYLFSATRIPGAEIDTSRAPYTDGWPGPSRERHVVVFRRGQLFRLDVLGPDGVPHSLDELATALRAIMAAAATPAEPGTSVGQLTTLARAEWATSRAALLAAAPANARSLDIVERALFCLCLEDVAPVGARAAADRLLHGDEGNRWFDKAVSLIVFADGEAGLNGEHGNLDGTTMIALIDALMDASSERHAAEAGARSQGEPDWEPITFVLGEALRADIRAAGRAFADYAAATASRVLNLDFDATRAKALRTSPDAFAQLAYQLAHRRARGYLGATYESIATRTHRHGRTEAMRVVTPELVRFVEVMDDPAASDETRRAAYRAAADAHVARARQCQVGDAPEQHLWALQLLQRCRGAELGVTEPLGLYETPGWLIMRNDRLSTSAVPSSRVRTWGFGSTSPACIGVGYALLADRFDLYLSTPRAVSEQMHAFADRLPEVVAELEALLRSGSP